MRYYLLHDKLTAQNVLPAIEAGFDLIVTKSLLKKLTAPKKQLEQVCKRLDGITGKQPPKAQYEAQNRARELLMALLLEHCLQSKMLEQERHLQAVLNSVKGLNSDYAEVGFLQGQRDLFQWMIIVLGYCKCIDFTLRSL